MSEGVLSHTRGYLARLGLRGCAFVRRAACPGRGPLRGPAGSSWPTEPGGGPAQAVGAPLGWESHGGGRSGWGCRARPPVPGPPENMTPPRPPVPVPPENMTPPRPPVPGPPENMTPPRADFRGT